MAINWEHFFDGAQSVDIQETRMLPNGSGLYAVMQNNWIVYIGRAADFNSRWRHHHKLRQFRQLSGNVRIAYIETSQAQAHELEPRLIAKLKPEYNNTPNTLGSRKVAASLNYNNPRDAFILDNLPKTGRSRIIKKALIAYFINQGKTPPHMAR